MRHSFPLYPVMAAAGLLASVAAGQPAAQENTRCLNCHGQRDLVSMSAAQWAAMVAAPADTPRADPQRLFFDRETFAKSVHRDLRCVDCHPAAETLPHAARLAKPTCATCHPDHDELFRRSVHARPPGDASEVMPTCATCHGAHEVFPPTDRRSRTYPLNVLEICGGCHRQHTATWYGDRSPAHERGAELVDSYLDSVHGRAVRSAGLVVAATCPDCHQAHEVLPSHDPRSSVSRQNVPTTCGRCHVGVAEQYADSVHGRLLRAGETERGFPVCNDCHSSHRITRADTAAFNRDIVEECGTCHSALYATYRESYHGQAQRLGHRRAARCSDCHGAHDIRPIAGNQVPEEEKIAMCGRCHDGANRNFAQFIAHADYRDPQRYPLLFGVWMYFVIIISVTFTLFGVHTILWWIRSWVERLRHGPARHEAQEGAMFQRFRPIDRLTHALVITSFMGLTLTGLPLRFSDQPWAISIANVFGGIQAAGILHRCFAFVMLVYVGIHLWVVTQWVLRKIRSGERGWLFGPDSMLPRWKDLGDILGMLRWFVGLGPKPRFDRWTYWEKFDYWADAVGTILIGGSGLLLAFPIVSSWLLPGWVFNVAMIVHGYEALLAIGFIFTVHFFNAHLRLEKFPTDNVIFTGQLSEHELQEERPLEYERLQQSGRLLELAVTPKSRQFLHLTRVLGVGLLLLGVSLVALIIYAGLQYLAPLAHHG